MNRILALIVVLLAAGESSAQVSNTVITLKAVEKICARLLVVPTDEDALQNLAVLSLCVQGADVRASAQAAYAMGMFYSEKTELGTRAVQRLQQSFPGSPQVAAFQGSRYQIDCPKCQGVGTVNVVCSRCGGRGSCRGCSGRGTIPRLSGAAAPCPACRGTGQCTGCQGSLRENALCRTCMGLRRILSRSLMREAFVELLEQTRKGAESQESEELRRQSVAAAWATQERMPLGGVNKVENLAKLLELAESGEAGAQYRLGTAYMRGDELEQNYAAGLTWLNKAAELGHVKAMFNLGLCYRKGLGVSADLKAGFRWWEKAAERGDAIAMVNVGLVCLEGLDGNAKDRAKGMSLFRKAAASKDEKAIALLRNNARAGMADAQTILQDAGLNSH